MRWRARSGEGDGGDGERYPPSARRPVSVGPRGEGEARRLSRWRGERKGVSPASENASVPKGSRRDEFSRLIAGEGCVRKKFGCWEGEGR